MERVLRVQMRRLAGWVRPGSGWISPQRSSVAVSKEKELLSAVNVQWKLCMQERVCLDGCMFVLMEGRVEDKQGSGPTREWEGRRGGSTEKNDETVVVGHG